MAVEDQRGQWLPWDDIQTLYNSKDINPGVFLLYHAKFSPIINFVLVVMNIWLIKYLTVIISASKRKINNTKFICSKHSGHNIILFSNGAGFSAFHKDAVLISKVEYTHKPACTPVTELLRSHWHFSFNHGAKEVERGLVVSFWDSLLRHVFLLLWWTGKSCGLKKCYHSFP